ncbi:MAG: Leucine-tRNA ligase [Microgenomates group bacterium GW2011_GWA2_46_7]|nr:MAG: Leucine-tRNA ligase [Microgenomates group bacterium GW2011_GWA2_46_7]
MQKKTYVLGMTAHPLGCFAALGPPTSHDNVMSPMGWDAFGLPAENAAIKAKRIPQEMVPHNYANFKKQMQNLSLDFDWEREFATTDPSYYAITQWIFLQLYKKKLVYREEVAINWCPKCKTGLANEEVLPDGTHERCGTSVGKKLLPQWVMKITAYAERLLTELDMDLQIEGKKLDPDRKGLDWPRGILEMQRNWIGKKEGVVIQHKVKDIDLTLATFSAYPAWLFADTFIVLAPEHPMVEKLIVGTQYEKEVNQFVKECSEITDQQRLEDKFEKKGAFTGRYAQDPFNQGREMPIWVANFAMMGFGTGIIRCSSHDVRDYAFAQNYQIETEFAEVVARKDPNEPINAHDNEGVLLKSGPFTGRVITPEG